MCEITELELGPTRSWILLERHWIEIRDGDFFTEWPSVKPLDPPEAQRATAAAEWLH